MAGNLQERAGQIARGCEPSVLARAVYDLFTKEAKSSFAIEGEAPSSSRANGSWQRWRARRSSMRPTPRHLWAFKTQSWIGVMPQASIGAMPNILGERSRTMWVIRGATTAKASTRLSQAPGCPGIDGWLDAN